MKKVTLLGYEKPYDSGGGTFTVSRSPSSEKEKHEGTKLIPEKTPPEGIVGSVRYLYKERK